MQSSKESTSNEMLTPVTEESHFQFSGYRRTAYRRQPKALLSFDNCMVYGLQILNDLPQIGGLT